MLLVSRELEKGFVDSSKQDSTPCAGSSKQGCCDDAV